MANAYAILVFILALVAPASDVERGDIFDITLQSSSAVALHIDPRLVILGAPGAKLIAPNTLQYDGSEATRYIRLRVRADAAPGLAWVWANGEKRTIRICCVEAPAPRFHVYLAMATKSP